MDAAKKQGLSPADLTALGVLLLLGVALFFLQTRACGFEAPLQPELGQIALVSPSSVGQNFSDWPYDASDCPVAAETGIAMADSAVNAMNGVRLAQRLSAESMFDEAGGLTQQALAGSRQIMQSAIGQ
jgi:hypothetical protein